MKITKDMLSLEAIKDEKGNVISFNIKVMDINFNPIYNGTISGKEYLNLISGLYQYVAIESER